MAIGGVESGSRRSLPSTPQTVPQGCRLIATRKGSRFPPARVSVRAMRCSSHAPHTDLARGFSEVLAVEVLERLACLEWVSAEQPRSLAEVARIRARLTEALAAWRRLLEKHRADEHNRCPQCRTWCGLRRAKAPCRIWITAHNHLIAGPAARPR